MEGQTKQHWQIWPLRQHPQLQQQAAAWFGEKWGLPAEVYAESIAAAVAGGKPVPQWYVALAEDGAIQGGLGVIENDFHRRPDLTPNVCAVFVEPAWRGQGLARAMLDFVRRDMAAMGVTTLYLLTDHDCFYEACGWQFWGLVEDTEGQLGRMYQAITGNTLAK